MVGRGITPRSKKMVYTISVTPEEVNAIGTALGQMSFNQVSALIEKLRQQIVKQEADAKQSEPQAPDGTVE